MSGPEVFIDGEKVEFSGAPPDGLEGLLAAVSPILAEAGRLIASVEVPGRGPVHELSAGEYAATGRIHLVTMTVAAAIAQVAAGNGERIASALEAVERCAGEVLRSPWNDARGKCSELGTVLGRIAEDAAGMTAAPGVADALGVYGQALERWMDAVQAGDAARVALRLDGDIVPAVARLQHVVAELAKGGDA